MARKGRKSAKGRSERAEPYFFAGRSDQSKDELRASRDDDFASRNRARGKAPKVRKGSKPKRHSFLGRLFVWAVTLSIWGCAGLIGLVIYYGSQLPPIDQLEVPKRPPNIAILGDDGTLLANRGDTGGASIHIQDLPPYLPKAFVAIEDRRFYSHLGIDPVGIGRAVATNIVHRGGVQGGSTLTQQLAKNLFLTQERTFSRKMQEAILALWLEHRYSKDQLLELYLNRVYFGSGCYGVEAAAEKYFGHSAKAVSLSEAALLAGLMKSPSRLAPNRNPDGAIARSKDVLAAMAEQKFITPAMLQLALSQPAHAVHEKGTGSINYAADYVMDVLDDTIGDIDGDISVVTTINPTLQTAGEAALSSELNGKGDKFGVSQGALVALDMDGGIKALIGGRNYNDSQFDRVTSAKRQPGSTFKPFVYLTALETGLTPDSTREDGPINVKGWQPENASHEYQGTVTLTKGLAMSLNTVAVRLGLEVGAKAIVHTAHRLGIASELQSNASIALGTSEVSPLEIADAYLPFANGGIGQQSYIIKQVRGSDGKKILYQRKLTNNGRVIEAQYVPMMNTMLTETLVTGTGKKANLFGWQAAGKTGTSQDYRDAWFIGYTSHMLTAVWLGNDDNSPTKKVSGANLPVEVWSQFMRVAHQNLAPQPLPGGLWRGQSDFPATEQLVDDGFGKSDLLQSNNNTPPVINDTGRPSWQNPARDSLVPPRSIPVSVPTNLPASSLSAQPSQWQTATPERPAPRQGSNHPVPPADIPGARSSQQAPPAEEKNFFQQLFGG